MNPIGKVQEEPMVKFYLFGTPSMEYRERPFTIPRRQARALLFYLAATIQPVPREKLTDLLWPDKSPAVARRNLTRLLSYLRRQLPEADLLEVSQTAVSLNSDLATSDTILFAQLSESGKSEACETAVQLYRESFLSGFVLKDNLVFDNWLGQEQRRWEQAYLKLLRQLVNDFIHLPEKAIRYTNAYLEVDDLAEDIHRELITLYAANGDRSAALRQYEACVIVLERELGVSPLPETYAAFEAARDGRTLVPPPKAPEPEWATLPGLDLPLIGREGAWEQMAQAYGRFKEGGVIFISGEPGVGKSRLMQEFASTRTELVLTGNSHADGRTTPYQPLVQALRQALPIPDRWQAAPIWLAEASRLLPELRGVFPDLAMPVAVEPEQAQARLFETLTQLFRGLAADGPLLLCLDDVHWTDEATLGWLQYVVKRLADSQIRIVATYRINEAEPLDGLRRTLGRARLMADVELGGLSETAVTNLLHQMDDGVAEPEQLAARIYSATGGNSFFVLETIRELVEINQLANPPADLPLPATVRETILRRTGRLKPLAQQILEISAVLSPLLTFPLINQTAGRGELETADSLEELVRHHLLSAKGDQFRFQHDLAREAVYGDISSWRRQLLHRRAGDILGELYAGEPESVAAQRAQHYDTAGAYEQAVAAYEMAAAEAQAVYAPEEAIRYLQRAINLLPEIEAASEQFARLYELLGINLENVGRFEAAREAFQQAIGFHLPENTMSLARLYWYQGRTQLKQLFHEKAEILLERALTTLGERPTQDDKVWRQLWLGIQMNRLTLLFYIQDIKRLDAHIQEMTPIVERTDSLAIKIEFYQGLFQFNLLKERFVPSLETMAIAENYLELALTTRNPWTIAGYYFGVGFGFFHAGDLNSAERYFLESLIQARRVDARLHEARALAFLSSLYRRTGDLEQTEKYAQLAGEKGADVGNRHFVGHSLANLSWLAYQNGELDMALEKAQQAARDFLDAKIPWSWLALMVLLAVCLDRGELGRAVEAAATMLDPEQQRLKDDIVKALETAVAAWEADDGDSVRDALETAVALARQHNYL